MPTDAEKLAHGWTVEQYDRRNKLWHTMLRQLPPDERQRINENPQGVDALILAGRVDMACKAEEK